MVLTKDVTIARNSTTSAPSPSSTGGDAGGAIVLPAGTRVKLIKTPKGFPSSTIPKRPTCAQ